jgi:hypothetical protein
MDSDYDVRFLYVHPNDWYLTIADKRDVIELDLNNPLDMNGWDIRKALKLLRKSNSPLMEWLSSPVVYLRFDRVMDLFKDLARRAFLPESTCHHYLSMAMSSMEGWERQDAVKVKNYMYAARTVLSCRWVIERLSHPPMAIQDLLATFLPVGRVRELLDRLLQMRRDGVESSAVERSPTLERYLREEIFNLQARIPRNPVKLPVGEFDGVFREILDVMKAEPSIGASK